MVALPLDVAGGEHVAGATIASARRGRAGGGVTPSPPGPRPP